MYVISNSMHWRGDKTVLEQLDDCLTTIREEFFSAENYAESDGRPTVKFWNISWVVWAGNDASAEVKDAIINEWGDFQTFGSYIRDELTVDGVEPYLIGGFGALGHLHDEDSDWIFDEQVPLARSFDAISNWTGDTPEGEKISQARHLDFQTRNFEGYQSLASNEPFEYIPVVNPGFDDRENDCWGGNKYIPPNESHFADLFELADEYRTVDRIDVASFNDWGEGHMIEPGTYEGDDFGTSYLQVVKEFVA